MERLAAGGAPIPGEQGGQGSEEAQTFDPPPEPSPNRGGVGEAIRIAAMGAACSTGIPWPSCSRACWRASRLYAAPGTHQAGSTVSVPPQILQRTRRTRVQSCRPSYACLRRRPWPMMATWQQAGHCLGSHSASYSPGLHPSPERGIKTITGAKATPRNRYPPRHMTPRPRLRS